MTPTVSTERFRHAILGGLVVLLVLVIYYPAFYAGFIWDDDRYVTENPLLSAPDGWWRIWFSQHHQSQYFPLVYSTLRLEYAGWGLHPTGYHIVNALLHAANALLFWAVLRRLAIPGAWLAAAIFAVHPVQVESVAWVTELKNTESTLFFWLALLAWMRFIREDATPWKFYGAALLMYVLALFSKTTACTLPAALVLILWLEQKRINRARIAQIIPFLAIGLVMGLVSIWWEGHMGNYADELHLSFTLPERLLISTRALWFYAGKLIWPAHLAFSYARWQINPSDPRQYLWLLGCLVVAAMLWGMRHRWGRLPMVAVVFFVATLSPMLGLVSEYTFRFSFVADHYQYLACAGLIALFAGVGTTLVARWHWPPVAQRTLGALLLAVLAARTWQQAGVYQNSETLWKDTLVNNPQSWLGENNLGFYLLQNGRGDESVEHFEAAIRLNPQHAKARVNLGMAYVGKGDYAQAAAQFEAALKIQPNYALAHYDLGFALVHLGKMDEAIEHLRQATRVDPKMSSAWANLVVALSQQGRKDEAMAALREQLKFEPGNLVALNNLAEGLTAEDKIDEAVATYRQALQVSPGNLALLNNLGNLLFTHGQARAGIDCLKQAAQKDPKNPGVRFNLAMMLAQGGDRAGAREQLVEALRLKPDFVQAQAQLRALDAAAAPPAK